MKKLVFALGLVLGCLLASADLVTYTGTNYGRWEVSGNWNSGVVPTAGDNVLIPASLCVTLDGSAQIASLSIATNAILSVAGVTTYTNTSATMNWRAPQDALRTDPVGLEVSGDVMIGGSLAIGGLNQSAVSYLTVGGDLILSNKANASFPPQLVVYAGPTNTTTTFQSGGARVTVAGGTRLASTNSVIYPYCHQSTGASVVFNLQDFYLTTNSQINATGRGYSVVYSPGSTNYYGPGVIPTSTMTGGSYGGRGGTYYHAVGPVYGFMNAPYLPGSPGIYSTPSQGMGGGVIRVSARNVALAGKLVADGRAIDWGYGAGYGAGSGGSVWITCSNFTAIGSSALISAKGGSYNSNSTQTGDGGGGRVAIMTGSPSEDQIDSLYQTGTCDNMLVITTNMADTVTSPYPTLVSVIAGTGAQGQDGKPGTSVWLSSKGSNRSVSVWSSPAPIEMVSGGVSPNYGSYLLPTGETSFFASSTVFLANTDERKRYTCLGYVWTNAVGTSGSGTSTNVTLDLTDDVQFTWLWGNLEYRLGVSSGGNGTVTQDYSNWYASGSSCTLTATPADGCRFLYWVGDVPFEDRTNESLSLTMDQPRNVTACFTTEASAARDLIWSGGLSSTDWFDPTNWDGVAIPGIYDHVVVSNALCQILHPAAISIASLELANGASLLLGATGSVETVYLPISPLDIRPYHLSVSGEVLVRDNAGLVLGGVNATSRVDLAVGGDLVLTNGATLRVAAGFAGSVTNRSTYIDGGAGVVVRGNTLIGTNCWVYPSCHQASGAPVVFDLQNLFVMTNAGFNANYHGFGRIGESYYGLGYTSAYVNGASYGGKGGGDYAAGIYGYTNAPFYPGSPANEPSTTPYYTWGGGAIRINSRRLALEGTLTANGNKGRSQAGGNSGGGIWLTCTSFSTGAGALLSAVGGAGVDGWGANGGGGGRIAVAVRLTDRQIEALYTGGDSLGMEVLNFADTPYASNYTVAGGTASQGAAGTTGSAVLITGTINPGTVVIIH